MTFARASGILLHPTSLPGPHGIGDVGGEAYRFADFLRASGQSLWQVLPLGPTGYGDSPYACYSAFAGNTLLVSPERLLKENLISESDLAALPPLPEESPGGLPQMVSRYLMGGYARARQQPLRGRWLDGRLREGG